MRTATLSEKLARFVGALDYDAIPERLRDKARLHLLDAVGVALASSQFEFAARAYAGLRRFGAGDYPVIGMRGKLTLRDAICMNGILVHGIEFDDTSSVARIHPSATCVPCALGVGASTRASGKALLTAYIAGVECAIRIGAAGKGGFSPAGFNATGVVGGFGAVLVAGRLLGLDVEQLASAQGIVYSTVAGSRESVASDAWTKRFDPAWAAVGGVTAAMLAAEGYQGPRSPYEGKFGFYRVYLRDAIAIQDLEPIATGLGEQWRFEDLALKALPSCYFNHALINATIEIVTRHDLAPSAIRSIRVLLPQAGFNTVCEPRALKVAPVDISSAQFSAYYNVASAAVRRRLTLEDLQPAALRHPEVLALADKITYGEDVGSNFPRHYTGAVEIETIDGRRLHAREDVNKGSAEAPLGQAEVERKFMDNAASILSRPRAQALRDALLGIDRVADVAEIPLSS